MDLAALEHSAAGSEAEAGRLSPGRKCRGDHERLRVSEAWTMAPRFALGALGTQNRMAESD